MCYNFVMAKLCSSCKTAECKNKASYCAPCKKERDKIRYLNNPSLKESVLIKQSDIRTFLREYKESKGCECCLKYFPYWQLDFDHVRGEKKFNISKASYTLFSFEALIEEIDKTQVVCANCHRDLTHQRMLEKKRLKEQGSKSKH